MLKKKRFIFFCLFTFLLSSACSYASKAQVWHPVISAGAGAAITSDLGSSQQFPLVHPITDSSFNYRPNGNTVAGAMFDIFVGAERKLTSAWALQLGMGYDQAFLLQSRGMFTQGIAPLVPHDYKYDVHIRQLLVESKLAYIWKDYYRPYFFLGLGAAFNRVSNYDANFIFPTLVSQFTRDYSDDTTMSFTYSVGTGIDVDLCEHMRLGLGYRFSDFGRWQLGQSTIRGFNVAGTLSQSHLYVNQVLAQLTFVF